MKIKTYRDESVAAALRNARIEMGPEALLLKTRKLTNALGYDLFEVTACVEDHPINSPDSRIDKDASSPVPERLGDTARDTAPEVAEEFDDGMEIFNKRLESIETKLINFIDQFDRQYEQDSVPELIACLKDSDCNESDIQQLIDNSNHLANGGGSIDFEKAVNDALVNQLTQIIEPRLVFQSGDSAIVFGPAGCGKTSFVSKLSAHLLSKYRLKVSPELLEFAQVSSNEFTPSGLGKINSYHSTDNEESETDVDLAKIVTVIDTPPYPQNNLSLEKLLDRFQELQPTHRFFVFSALTRNADLQEIIEIVQLLQPTHLVMTMADLTNRYGSVLSVARKLSCRLAFITDSPGGIGEIKIPRPNDLASAIMKQEEHLCKD